VTTPSGLSTLIKDRLSGGASRLAALLLPQILPVSSVVAPCDPGAPRRQPVLVQRGQATSSGPFASMPNVQRPLGHASYAILSEWESRAWLDRSEITTSSSLIGAQSRCSSGT